MAPASLKLLFALALVLSAQATQAQSAKGKDDSEPIQINDQLTAVDPIDPKTGTHHKVHVVKLQADKTYLITILRKDEKQFFNPYLRIEDSAGKELISQAGNGTRVRAKLTPTKDDTYRLISSSQGGVGEYVLKISPSVPIKVIKDHDPEKVLDLDKAGFELSSRLTAKDPRDKVRAQMFAKVFLVKMIKGKVYTIEMGTRQFDAYLRLEDAAGKQLAEDDDSGGNLDALITFRAPETGTYRVITTSFAANAQGEYLLRIQEE